MQGRHAWLGGVAIGLALALAGSAPAATLTVGTERDRGQASLRKTIDRATVGDTVRVPRGDYRVTRGAIEVDEPIAIRGAGAKRTIVDANRRSRVFDITAPAETRMAKLTVTGGRDSVGAGIVSIGPLVLDRMRISRNRAATGDFARFGAGVSAGDDLTVNRSVFTRNVVVGGGGQNFGAGLSLVSGDGDLLISRSTFTGNRVTGVDGYGGAVFMSSIPTADPPNLSIRNSTITDNSTPSLSGGVHYQATDGAGLSTSFRITGTTIADNEAAGGSQGIGGGIYTSAVLTDGDASMEMLIANSTLSGNVAGDPDSAGYGGGAYLSAVPLNGSTISSNLNNVTVAGNRAFVAGGNGGGGGIFGEFSLGAPAFTNTIVAGNSSPGDPTRRDCYGDILSNGNNLETAQTCGFTSLGDIQNENPMLEPLRQNGGPTPTRALKPGSPAINKGSNAGCEPRDQRGIPRPQGPRCDIGAYERKR